jgi:hypothetical protein
MELLVYLEDGSCPKRAVVLSQALASQVIGARLDELRAWKKGDRPRYDEACTRGALAIQQLEGIVTLRFAPRPSQSDKPQAPSAPPDYASWMPCVESVERPSPAEARALVAFAAQCLHDRDHTKRARGGDPGGD